MVGLRAWVVVVLVLGTLAACGSDGGSTSDTTVPSVSGPTAPTTTTTAPTTTSLAAPAPSVEGLSATIEQGRPYVARDLLELFIRSEAAATVELVTLRLVDPRFEPVAPTARNVTIPPGLGARSMPISYGRAVCDLAGEPAPPVVEVARVDGSLVAVPVDAPGQAFLAGFHADKCTMQRIAEAVHLSWGPPITRVDDAVVELVLQVDRVGGGDPVTIHQIGGTVIFAQRLVEPGSVPATLGADEESLTIAVELSAARCEAHALTESNKTFLLNVWVGLGDDPSQRLEVEALGEARAVLNEIMQAGCFGTLD